MKNARTLIPALIIAATAGFATYPSFAQPRDCNGMGPMGGERGQSMRADRMQNRQQQLHDALKLKPEQEAAWTKFQSTHPFANGMQRPDRAEIAKLTAPERAEKMLEQQKKHQEAMSQHVSAMKAFYDQLTPEQKKVFDEHSMQRPNRGDRGPRGGGPGPRGPGGPGAGMPPAAS